MTINIEQILEGTVLGAPQTVGHMQVIPVLGADDTSFAPPSVEVGTSGYGSVLLKNDADRPTIVPPGAGWVVRQRAQDHAIGGGALLRAGEDRKIETAICIQQSQGGTITLAKHAMLILPVALRAKALAMRAVSDFRKHWNDIGEFNRSVGVSHPGGHLEFFLRTFQKELDRFVAEFEIVPGQLGAIVLLGGKLAGIERAPSAAFWHVVWEPLIRVSYGSLAIQVDKRGAAPPTRAALPLSERTVAGVRKALDEADAAERSAVEAVLSVARSIPLERSAEADDTIGPVALTTVSGTHIAGQLVTVGGAVRFASLCVAA